MFPFHSYQFTNTFFISPELEFAMATEDLAKQKPEVMPECWQEEKPDAQKCVEATKALCEAYR